MTKHSGSAHGGRAVTFIRQKYDALLQWHFMIKHSVFDYTRIHVMKYHSVGGIRQWGIIILL